MLQTKDQALNLTDSLVAHYAIDPRSQRALERTRGGSFTPVLITSDLRRRSPLGLCMENPLAAQCSELLRDRIRCILYHLPPPRRLFCDSLLDPLLSPAHRGFPAQFWANLELLHGLDQNWTRSGLTLCGRNSLEAAQDWIRTSELFFTC